MHHRLLPCIFITTLGAFPIETPSNGGRDFHPYRGGKNPYRGGGPWFRWRRLFSIVYITKHPPHHLHYNIINRRTSHTTLYVHYKVWYGFSSDSGLWGFIRCVNGGDPLISWSGGGIKVAGGLGDLN